MKTRENTDQDGRIKATDYDLYKAQERASELAKQADAREFELRRTTEAYEAASADLMRGRDDQARNMDESSQLSRALDLKMSEKSELVRRSEGELGRNRDFSATLYDFEAKGRAADDNLTAQRREQDDLRFATQSMQGQNGDLRAEVDALQHHCNVLAGQNVELNTELERFVQTDEQIRHTLNRRDRVETLRHKTETEMRASYQVLERSSPRRCSRH
jgi:chromosome segregation ATPase